MSWASREWQNLAIKVNVTVYAFWPMSRAEITAFLQHMQHTHTHTYRVTSTHTHSSLSQLPLATRWHSKHFVLVNFYEFIWLINKNVFAHWFHNFIHFSLTLSLSLFLLPASLSYRCTTMSSLCAWFRRASTHLLPPWYPARARSWSSAIIVSTLRYTELPLIMLLLLSRLFSLSSTSTIAQSLRTDCQF